MTADHQGTAVPARALLDRIDPSCLERWANQKERIRALDLFMLGRVRHGLVSGARLLGEVEGSRDVYRSAVEVHSGDDGLRAVGRCQCGRRQLCRHALALVYAWLYASEGFVDLDRWLESMAQRPRGELLGLLRKIVEEEPQLLAVVQRPHGPVAPGAALAEDSPASGSQPVAFSAAGPVVSPPPAAGAAATTHRPRETGRDLWLSFLRRLQESVDLDPEELAAWTDGLEKVGAEDPSSPAVGNAGDRLPAALGLLRGALWRQAALAAVATADHEPAAAGLLRRRWQGWIRLISASGLAGPLVTDIAGSARLLGADGLLLAARVQLEAGRARPALALARQALALSKDGAALQEARRTVAAALDALGRTAEAVPYLAANFDQSPDLRTLGELERAARASGRWHELSAAVERRLAQVGEGDLYARYLVQHHQWEQVAALVARDRRWTRWPTALLLACADGLRRDHPRWAASLYRVAMERGGLPADVRALEARWTALAHRLGQKEEPAVDS